MIEVSAVAHIGARGMDQGVVLHGAAGTLEADVFFGISAEIRGAQHAEQDIELLAVPDQLWEGVNRTGPFDAQMIDLFCVTHSIGHDGKVGA